MRPITLLSLFAVSACASSASKPEPEISKPTERIIATDNQGVIRSTAEGNVRVAIEVPPSRVLAVIKSVYDDVGIPASAVDAATGTITAPRFYKMGKLGNTNLSMYFNCGESLNGTIANTYRIYITVVSVVRPDGKGGSQLETAVTGAAADMGGAASGRIPCGSTGRLEERIQNGVLQKAGAGD